MKFPYTELPAGEGESVFRPLIPLRLGYPKTHKVTGFQVFGLIDSGADNCLFQKYIGEWLGVDFKKCPSKTVTAANGGPIRCKTATIELHVAGKIYNTLGDFTEDLPPQHPIILGHTGFFDQFKITFDFPNKEMVIVQ